MDKDERIQQLEAQVKELERALEESQQWNTIQELKQRIMDLENENETLENRLGDEDVMKMFSPDKLQAFCEKNEDFDSGFDVMDHFKGVEDAD